MNAETASETIVEMMDRADLLELSMMDLTFAVGALGMIDGEQFGIMKEWAEDLSDKWAHWKHVRGYTSEQMWKNMAMMGLSKTREFVALNKAKKDLRAVWKRRPLGLTA